MMRLGFICIALACGLSAQPQTFQTAGPGGKITRAPAGKDGQPAPKAPPQNTPAAPAPRAAQPAQQATQIQSGEPVPIYRRNPGYTFEALAAEFEGSERVRFSIDKDGATYDVRGERALPFGLDERSTSMVRAWRYRPGSPRVNVTADMVFRMSNRVVPDNPDDPVALHAAAVKQLNAGMGSARRAFALYTRAAEKGYVPSQVALCWLNMEGWETPRNFQVARQWCEKAAAQNSAAAQHMLGEVYSQGKGVARNNASAMSWYTKAGQQNYPPSEAALGKAYRFGNLVKADPSRAAMWLEKAARHGVPEAQHSFADLLQTGAGVKADRAQAFFWKAVAARQGYLNSMSELNQLRTKIPAAQVKEAERSADMWSAATH
jgi:hypothetical protein